MWQVTATQNDEAWLDDYISEIIAHEKPPLPDRVQHIGQVEVVWYPWDPGTAHIQSSGGTPDDRVLAEHVVAAQLEGHGYRRAVHSLYLDPATPLQYPNAHYATWDDVMAKAKRLIQSGAVQLIRNAANVVVGWVQGDHGQYQTEINRDDPTNPNAISGSQCQCDWGDFQNTPRTRIWKKYQDRVCSHILATNWLAQSIPTDEQRGPGDQGGAGQMTLPGMGVGPQVPSSQMGIMQQVNAPGGTMYGQPVPGQVPPPGQAAPPPAGMPPAPADLLPQFPMDPSLMPQVNPASVPGGRPGPTPTNPLQYPGGTFSSWTFGRQADIIPGVEFVNGDMVQLKNADQGTAVGRSQEHGAGQLVQIPRNSIGEVLGVDPVSKMVNVMYTGPQAENRQMEPWGTVAWHWPSDVIKRPDIKSPGPAVRSRVPRL